MKLIVAYFIFIVAVLITLSVFGGSYAQADAEPQAETLETAPAKGEPGALAFDASPVNVDN